MECLEANQIVDWAERNGLVSGEGFSVNLPLLPIAHHGVYAHGKRSREEAKSAAEFVSRLGKWEECVVWIRGWGVWPSGEDWPKFYSWRGGFGERRSLDTAPAHRFGAGEITLVVELVTLVMENAWDADVLCSVNGCADKVRARISHDEWFEICAAG